MIEFSHNDIVSLSVLVVITLTIQLSCWNYICSIIDELNIIALKSLKMRDLLLRINNSKLLNDKFANSKAFK